LPDSDKQPEAVFGLGCDPSNTAAVARLLKAKERDRNKGLILVASRQAQLNAYMASVTAEQQQRLDKAWPGPVTFIVPAAEGASAILTGGRKTIAVRVSALPWSPPVPTSRAARPFVQKTNG